MTEEWAFAVITEDEVIDEELYVTTINESSWRPEVKLPEEQEAYYDKDIQPISKPQTINQSELVHELMKQCLALQQEVSRLEEIIKDDMMILLERERKQMEDAKIAIPEEEQKVTEETVAEEEKPLGIGFETSSCQENGEIFQEWSQGYSRLMQMNEEDCNCSVTKTKALAQLLTETLSSVINHSVYTAFSTWLPKDYHQCQRNQWKLEDQQRYMMKCEDSCLTSMKKSSDTCISSEQCLVSDEFIMKHIQEEIIQEENGEVMGLDPPITWTKQYENGMPKELILPISEDRRPKQRWAFRATGYGGPLLKVQYFASVLENGEYVTRDIFPTIIICQESKSKGVHQY
ncbi:hypothetical protein E3N88_23687 [Mikania micrantha]|uniref:Uncharacterized protein n=1 Tax=Mikania micrantha TaxID=192012 RepID=A0A5N6NDZ1_9ASTR|nr:hypothetical protein E3N88_23687 [Mikania micrantha]